MEFFIIPSLLTVIDLICYLIRGKRLLGIVLIRLLEIINILVFPGLYLAMLDIDQINDCCSDSAVFSPDHRFSVYILIIFCIMAYFYASYRHSLAPPLLEVLVNVLLLTAIVLNIFVGIQAGNGLWAYGNVPIVILYVFALIKNHQLFISQAAHTEFQPANVWERVAWQILSLSPLARIPLLLVLSLPVLVILSAILLLFGQKPDSMIRAFTDTYKHGFSQLDYQCENITCGGHFLCSIAAQGHNQVVKPQRLGERGGHRIICNRQLLIANAFEELLEQRLPRTHRFIRSHYNRVGNLIHRHYGIFENKYLSDCIYLLMKPLEWAFLLVLYTFDTKPENRIAQQYLNPTDRIKLKQQNYKNS